MADQDIVLRRLARDLSLRRRFERLTVRDLVRVENLRKVLLVLAFRLGRCDKEEEKDTLRTDAVERMYSFL